MIKAFIIVIALLIPSICHAAGTCPPGLPVSGSNCYFVSAGGADTNNGTSDATPWLHSPGMPSCANTCLSTTIVAGNGVIFRGGDTWHFGNSGASPYTGGTLSLYDLANWGDESTCIYESTQTGCIYYGVDKTWFTGGAWARPIFTGDNSTSTSLVGSCTYTIPNTGAQFVTNALTSASPNSILDNFEMTGVCANTGSPVSGRDNVYIAYFGTGINGKGMSFMENLYIHGWTATTTAGQAGNNQPGTIIGGGTNGLQTLDTVVIDGSDSNPGSWAWATFPSFYHMRNSIVRYTNQGVGQWCHDIHDNIFEHMYNHNSGAGSHTNILECNRDGTGDAVGQPQNTPNVFYNNIVRHDDISYSGSGQVHLWFCPETIPEYWFNNILYDMENSNWWDYAGPPIYSCLNTGGQFMFNNTFVDGTQPCYVSNTTDGGAHLTVLNEHLMNTPYDSGTTACTGHNDSTNIAQTDANAVSQGYLLASGGTLQTNTCANESTTPCAPTSSGNATVVAGANHQAYCATLATYTSENAIGTTAANACKYGTTDGCAYNETTHTMSCPAQTAVLRPVATAWDSGAYEFLAGQSQGQTGFFGGIKLFGGVKPF